jgi:hypothetical protein
MSQLLLMPEAPHTTYFPASPRPPYLSIVLSPRWFTSITKDPFNDHETATSISSENYSSLPKPQHYLDQFLQQFRKHMRLFLCCILNSCSET